MYVKVGTYVGTGSSNPRTGVGFAPVAVFIKRGDGSTINCSLVGRWSSMAGDLSTELVGAGALLAGHITRQ